MIAWLVRLAMRLGLRWLIVTSVARWVVRRFGRGQVDGAIDDLETAASERLPAPVARAVSKLPPEAKQIGGSAVVAGRAARSAAVNSRRAASIAADASRRAAAVPASARGAVERVKAETEASGRRLRSQYLAETMGPDAATDALLDVRTERPDRPEPGASDDDLHDHVPDPVTNGRRRFRPRAAVPVGRMKRSYRPPPKPWE